MTTAWLIAAAAMGYAFGCIPVANLVARRHGIADLRVVGDRNPGYWNARALVGARAALPILLLDAAKGAAGAGFGLAVAGFWGGILGWLGAILGHMFPAPMGFRGGRSLLCLAGGAIVIVPLACAVSAVVLLAVRWRFGFARGIQACLIVAPFAIWFFYGAGYELGIAVGLLLFIGVRAFLADRALARAGIPKHQDERA
ncbi:MAG: glycerol-3-phosphate acyltransferase [Gaiellales bacterium]